MSTHDSGQLFREWDLYARIVADNWMRHRELAGAIRGALGTQDRPVAVLDLGCGDGWMGGQVLRDCPVKLHVGIDLSESALQRFQAWTEAPGRPTIIRRAMHGGMEEQVPGLHDEAFDIVLANYSLHHLRSDQKSSLLTGLARVMRPGGRFVWTDAVRDESENREAYLDRLAAEIQERWVTIPLPDRHSSVEHIRQCDFPETESWMIAQVEETGMKLAGCLYRDDFFGAWMFIKAGQAPEGTP